MLTKNGMMFSLKHLSISPRQARNVPSEVKSFGTPWKKIPSLESITAPTRLLWKTLLVSQSSSNGLELNQLRDSVEYVLISY